jgi:hypothetical protein
VIDLLDQSPTRVILDSAYHGYNGHYYEWSKSLCLLAVAFFACVLIGDRVAAWALRRPGDHADRTSSRHVARRRQPGSPLSVLIATDHASLWRSVPLRRGVLVLVIVPGLVAALAGMSWQSLVLVPGLIAAGAGLLFGINAFALDYTGAVWLATLPQWPKYAFISKAVVFAEVTLAAVVSALVGGSLRSDAPDRPAEVVAAIASALCCAALVVALGMRSSLRHPHRAALSGPRDTPATPGVMAAQSVKFALLSTLTALFFGAMALATSWWIPAVASIPILVACWLHLSATAEAWAHPHVRAHVVTTVSAG